MLLFLIMIWIVKAGAVLVNDTTNATLPTTGSDGSIGVTPMIDLDQGLNSTSLSIGVSAETMEELEDNSLQEGDILVSHDRNAVKALWPLTNGVASIPFTISSTVAAREASILAAFRMLSEHTCIRFHRRTTEMNYLKIRRGKGCASFVGCRGGAQPVFFSKTCSVGNLCHELMHALGLHHEHTRFDRDHYITVAWGSVIKGREKNFLVKEGDTLNLPYDVNSIMHYGKYFFSSDRNPTIVPKQGGAAMGQRSELSSLDRERLRRLYHCGH